MLNVLWADADQVEFPADAPISEYRRKKLAAIKPSQARRCSLCVELLLNEALRMAASDFPLPPKIEADANGKPFLSGHEYEFSLSHSAHFAACALSDVPIGLDIQVLSRCEERLVKRFFAEGEQAAVFSSNDRDKTFTRLWCRKESFLKAIGTGLRLPLGSFDVSAQNTMLPFRGTEYGFREYRTDDLFFCFCMPRGALPEEFHPQRIELP